MPQTFAHLYRLVTKPLLLLVISAFIFPTVFANDFVNNTRFKTLHTGHGLSNSSIGQILQDNNGFIWIVTSSGLNRFDGYTFKVFKKEPGNPHSIASNDIYKLFSDSQGYLWALLKSEGISVYEPENETFRNFYFSEAGKSGQQTSGRVLSILEDSRKTLWLGTVNGLYKYNRTKKFFVQILKFIQHDGKQVLVSPNFMEEDKYGNIWMGLSLNKDQSWGVLVFDPVSQKYQYINPDVNDKQSIGNYHISNIYSDNKGYIWFSTLGGGLKLVKDYRPQTIATDPIHFSHYLDFPLEDPKKLCRQINSIFQSSKGDLWLLTANGLFRLQQADPDKHAFEYYKVDAPRGILKELIIGKIAEDKNGNIWVGSFHTDVGLCLFDEDKKCFRQFLHNPNNEYSIAQNAFNSLFVDRDNILWIGTKNKGISQLDLNNRQFLTYNHIEGDASTISSNQVYGITEDGSGNIWVGTGYGLNKLNPQNQRFRSFVNKSGNDRSINENSIFCLHGDSKGQIWTGYFWMQLSLFDPVSHTNKRFLFNPNDSTSFNGWSLRQITEDKNGDIWIATGEGLFVYYRKTNVFQKLKLVDENPYVTSFQPINCVYLDREENILVGSTENGLYLLRKGKTKFENIKSPHSPSDRTPSDNYINCIVEDEKGLIWLGTHQGGLNSFDKKTGKFTFYTTKDGLCDNSIKGIIPDGKGNLWMSTNNGLSVFSTSSKQFRNYYKEDGIQGNEFNICSYFKSKNGRFYFGGMNGLTSFYPDSIFVSKKSYIVKITELQLFNKIVNPGDTINGDVVLKKSITLTDKITLTHKNNFFTLTFASLQYSAPKKIQYQYKLDDFEKEWNQTDGNRRTVTYTNIPHGTYKFLVKATNNDGVWNQSTTELTIEILPPWWGTWYFKTFSALMLALTITLFFLWRIKELKSRQRKLEKLVKLRTSDLLLANQLLEEKQAEILRQTTEIIGQRDYLKLQNQTLDTISKIGKKITSSIIFSDILERIYVEINTLIDAPVFSIGIMDQVNQKIDFKGFYQNGEVIENDSISLNQQNHLSLECIKNRKSIIINNAQTELKGFNIIGEKYLTDSSPKSMVYLPLVSIDERVIGILIVKSYQRNSYSQKHILFLENLASYITIALENARLYKELEESTEKLKNLDLLKTRFFINISHELRTPLTLIIEPVRKLVERTNHFTHEAISDQLRLVQRNANRLYYLINQILDARKVETGSETLQATNANFATLVKGIAELFGPLATEHKIRLTIHTPKEGLWHWIDVDKMEKTITNLLSNALKYTRQGGNVSVVLRAESHQIILEISDTGEGIPEKDLPYIFNRFYQVEKSPDNHYIGSGIGLSIVKDYVELHGGTICVESKNQAGTTFTIVLPQNINSPDELNSEKTDLSNRSLFHSKLVVESSLITQNDLISIKTTEHKKKEYKLLLVEDNQELRTYLFNELSDDYEVDVAENGKTGIEKALEEFPDIIVSDVLMPIMNGLELCEHLKTDQRTSHIPIILLTAQAETQQQVEGLTTGADDYIIKPFNLEVLKAKLKAILAAREALRKKYASKYTVNVSEITVTSYDESFLKKAIMLVEERITDPDLNVDSFVENLGISRTNLFKKIKALTGFTITEFIRDIRLKRAIQYLTETNYSISEIIYHSGFKSRSYFIQCFKEKHNMLPTEYRKIRNDQTMSDN